MTASRAALRSALTIPLVALTAYSCFGFLASGEAPPPASNAYRLLYGTIIVVCVAAIVAVWRVKSRTGK